jgi:hypothetical protein
VAFNRMKSIPFNGKLNLNFNNLEVVAKYFYFGCRKCVADCRKEINTIPIKIKGYSVLAVSQFFATTLQG